MYVCTLVYLLSNLDRLPDSSGDTNHLNFVDAVAAVTALETVAGSTAAAVVPVSREHDSEN